MTHPLFDQKFPCETSLPISMEFRCFQKLKHPLAVMEECFAAKNFLKMIQCGIILPNAISALGIEHRKDRKIIPVVAIKLGAFLHLTIKHRIVGI